MSEVLIEGVWVPSQSGAEQVVHNPATLQPVATVPFCDAQDVVLSMSAARRALERWRTCPRQTRIALLAQVGRELTASASAIAEQQALESGQPFRECLDGALAAAGCFSRLCDTEPGVARDACRPTTAASRPLILDQDYPLLDWACSAVPLLEGGSTLVCVAPRTAALAVLRAARCTGVLPAGVLNVLVAAPEGVAAALGDAFLRQYGRSAEARVACRRRDTVFVSSTAGLDLTLARAASLRLFHNGQRAGQSARIYVEEQIAHELADRLHQYLAFLECGDPRNPVTDLGPLRSSAGLQRAEDQVASALRHGTLLKLGGRRYQPWGLRGYFFQPTLMVEGRGAERAPVEEIPGPVLLVSPVRGLVEAVRHELAGGIAFFGHDAEAQLRSLTAARVDFTVGNIASPLERIMHSFRGAPKGPVRIETVTAEHGAQLADRARAAPT